MKKKVKTIAVVNAYRVLSGVKTTKLEDAAQLVIGKAIRSIKKVAKEYIENEVETKKMLEPENISELGIIEAKGETATAEERVTLQKDMGEYNRAIERNMDELAKAEVELDIEPIGFDILLKLAAANEMPLGAAVVIDDVFGE
ncbi:MAG: hypothetical protein K2K00_03720 [Muribaculaceae bacterium]|nr:hypothetical protein [Muribaculaceae bacterium]